MLSGLIAAAQSTEPKAGDRGDPLVQWGIDCSKKGCLIQADLLRGISDDPPDANDEREYISIYIAIDRQTRTPAYFAFHVDPRAAKADGILIAFTKTRAEGRSFQIDLDSSGAIRLPITECTAQSCVARIACGKANIGAGEQALDLLQKFLDSASVIIMYRRDVHWYRTMVLLSPYRKAYDRVLKKELPAIVGP